MILSELFTPVFLVRLIATLIGTAGFSILFRVRPRLLPYAVIGGGITYAVYYFTDILLGSVFAAGLLAAIAFSIYSELMARIKRAPAVVFLLPSAISIVPGGSLYHTMINLLSQNYVAAWEYLLEALRIGIGIAGGMAAVSLLVNLINGLRHHIKAGKKKKKENS